MKIRSACSGLATALLLSTTLLGGCASQRFTDISAEGGDPLIVASPVSVDVTRYRDAVSGQGGRVERRNIQNYVVMPRAEYTRLLAEQSAALDSVKRAHEAVASAAAANSIRDTLARACRANPVCYAEARPALSAMIDGGKK